METRVHRLKLHACCFIIALMTLLIANMELEGPAPIILKNIEQPCDGVFYVVGEGETLYTIAEKCNDQFIFPLNPQIQDPDDIFPGVILRLKPV